MSYWEPGGKPRTDSKSCATCGFPSGYGHSLTTSCGQPSVKQDEEVPKCGICGEREHSGRTCPVVANMVVNGEFPEEGIVIVTPLDKLRARVRAAEKVLWDAAKSRVVAQQEAAAASRAYERAERAVETARRVLAKAESEQRLSRDWAAMPLGTVLRFTNADGQEQFLWTAVRVRREEWQLAACSELGHWYTKWVTNAVVTNMIGDAPVSVLTETEER